MPNDQPSVFARICILLQDHDVPFEVKEHEPTYSSKQSAAARGESLSIGGKALLLKCDDRFVLCVIPADRKLNSKAVKSTLGVKKVRFATKDELVELTGLVPGAVPPFGRPIFAFDMFVDQSIYEREKIAFNAGDLCRSIIMSTVDHSSVAKPHIMTVCS